jgi:Uma2 family endonuclease
MTVANSPPISPPLLLDVSNTTLKVTLEQFDLLCANNPDVRLEMSKDGDLIVMPQQAVRLGRVLVDFKLQLGNVSLIPSGVKTDSLPVGCHWVWSQVFTLSV